MARPFFACEVCGKSFQKTKGGRRAGRACSRTCGFDLQRRQFAAARVKREAERQEARELRLAQRALARIDKLAAIAKAKAERPLYVLTCQRCNVGFQARLKRAFCTTHCRRRHYKGIEKRVRRARERQALVEQVIPAKVFRRDGWHCQLCGRSTPRRYQGQMRTDAPELDHIVPLAAGGPHTYANTQCACRSCNMRKGAKPLGQLRLVG